VWRSECVEIGLDGPAQRPINPRERGVFTRHRAKGIASLTGDTVVHGEKGGLNFRYTCEMLTFPDYMAVSPHNNHAEQQMRTAVHTRKVSQQNRSLQGP